MVVPQNIRDLIIKHHNNGRSVRSIAQQLDIPKSTVNNILQHYMKTGSIQTNYIGRCGRPRRLSDREERTLSRASVINPVATARQLRATVGGRVASVSLSTIKRALTHQGRLAYRPRKSPSLNRAQQITRLRWCQQHSSWDIDKWMQVIFSDETYLDVCGPQSHFVRRSSGEPIRIQHTSQHRPFLKRVMFWGAMLATGPQALIAVTGTMSSAKYVSILQDNVIEFLESQPLAQSYTFQHDNAPSHKARSTVDFLRNNAVSVLTWPPYSPDLNPIENLWGAIKRKVREEGVSSPEELITRVHVIWNSPEIKNLCLPLVASMPRRIALCISNKGGYTKY